MKRVAALLLCILIFCTGLLLGNSTSKKPVAPVPTVPVVSVSPSYKEPAYDAVTSIELDGSATSSPFTVSIKSLSTFKNLRALKICHAEISDPENLPLLRGLKHLELSNCDLRDITAVGRLSNLTTLNLSDNQITDISPLADLTYLFALDLSGNNILSFEPLDQLGFLQDLDLSLTSEAVYSPRSTSREETGISSFGKYAALDRLSSLETLNLSYNGFSSDAQLEFLHGMTGLKSLDLSGNDLKFIVFPNTLSGLRKLDISGNPLRSLEGFETLTGLETLDAADYQLNSLEPLAALKRLRHLYLGAGMFAGDEPIIDSFEPLTELKLLEELIVSSANVPALECLIGNQNLQVEYFRAFFPSGWMSVEEAIRACEEYVPLTPESINATN